MEAAGCWVDWLARTVAIRCGGRRDGRVDRQLRVQVRPEVGLGVKNPNTAPLVQRLGFGAGPAAVEEDTVADDGGSMTDPRGGDVTDSCELGCRGGTISTTIN